MKVEDKRKFDSDGNLRDEQSDEEIETAEEEEPSSSAAAEGESAEALGAEPKSAGQPAEINFATFILSLGTQAMIALGLVPDPIENEVKLNLPLAKQMIDIIAMLREKTRGNLEAGEITLLDNLLYDLRTQYVEQSKGK